MTTFSKRKRKDQLATWLFAGFVVLTIGMLATLLITVIVDGWPWLSRTFVQEYPSRFPEKAGVRSAIFGTLWILVLTALFAIPVGIASAIFLEEFVPASKFKRMIDVNMANLSGVPSIVYGILGLAVFVRYFAFGRSILSGALTMALLILPSIIIVAREAILAVPPSLRHAAYALGATKMQTVRYHVIPVAMPGIFTGIVLALSRAIGETSPLILIGALSFIAFDPRSAMDGFTVLPIQIFNWASRPQEEFHGIAAAGILVLLGTLLGLNGIAIFLRQRMQKGRP